MAVGNTIMKAKSVVIAATVAVVTLMVALVMATGLW
jgi:hypothetical protein